MESALSTNVTANVASPTKTALRSSSRVARAMKYRATIKPISRAERFNDNHLAAKSTPTSRRRVRQSTVLASGSNLNADQSAPSTLALATKNSPFVELPPLPQRSMPSTGSAGKFNFFMSITKASLATNDGLSDLGVELNHDSHRGIINSSSSLSVAAEANDPGNFSMIAAPKITTAQAPTPANPLVVSSSIPSATVRRKLARVRAKPLLRAGRYVPSPATQTLFSNQDTNAPLGSSAAPNPTAAASANALTSAPLSQQIQSSKQGHQFNESTAIQQGAAALDALISRGKERIDTAYRIQRAEICEDMHRQFDEQWKRREEETVRWVEEERQAREEEIRISWNEAMVKVHAYHAHEFEKRMVQVEKENGLVEEERDEERKQWLENKERLERMVVGVEETWKLERDQLYEEKKMLEVEHRREIQRMVEDAKESLNETTAKWKVELDAAIRDREVAKENLKKYKQAVQRLRAGFLEADNALDEQLKTVESFTAIRTELDVDVAAVQMELVDTKRAHQGLLDELRALKLALGSHAETSDAEKTQLMAEKKASERNIIELEAKITMLHIDAEKRISALQQEHEDTREKFDVLKLVLTSRIAADRAKIAQIEKEKASHVAAATAEKAQLEMEKRHAIAMERAKMDSEQVWLMAQERAKYEKEKALERNKHEMERTKYEMAIKALTDKRGTVQKIRELLGKGEQRDSDDVVEET